MFPVAYRCSCGWANRHAFCAITSALVEFRGATWLLCGRCVSADPAEYGDFLRKGGYPVIAKFDTSTQIDVDRTVAITDGLCLKKLHVSDITAFPMDALAKIIEKSPFVKFSDDFERSKFRVIDYSNIIYIGGLTIEFSEANLRWCIRLLEFGWMPDDFIITRKFSDELKSKLVEVMLHQPSIVRLSARLDESSWMKITSTNSALLEVTDSHVLHDYDYELYSNRQIWSYEKHRGMMKTPLGGRVNKYLSRGLMYAMLCLSRDDENWLPRDIIEQDILPAIPTPDEQGTPWW